jgi:hypothetical protein
MPLLLSVLAHVRRVQRQQRLRVPVGRHELDLDAVRQMDLHEGASIAGPQAGLRDIVLVDDVFDKTEIHGRSTGVPRLHGHSRRHQPQAFQVHLGGDVLHLAGVEV